MFFKPKLQFLGKSGDHFVRAHVRLDPYGASIDAQFSALSSNFQLSIKRGVIIDFVCM